MNVFSEILGTFASVYCVVFSCILSFSLVGMSMAFLGAFDVDVSTRGFLLVE